MIGGKTKARLVQYHRVDTADEILISTGDDRILSSFDCKRPPETGAKHSHYHGIGRFSAAYFLTKSLQAGGQGTLEVTADAGFPMEEVAILASNLAKQLTFPEAEGPFHVSYGDIGDRTPDPSFVYDEAEGGYFLHTFAGGYSINLYPYSLPGKEVLIFVEPE